MDASWTTGIRMAINKKGIFETLAHKISNIDSNTSTSVIVDTLKAVKKADHNTIVSYDSDGVLPTASVTNYRLAYVTNVGQLRFNNRLQWDKLQTQLPSRAPLPPAFGGTVAGYSVGGQRPALSNIVEKYPFVSDGNSSDVGDLSQARYGMQGVQSSLAGYAMGGRTPNAQSSNNINKITFASDTVGQAGFAMSTGRQQMATNGVSTDTHAYGAGGGASNEPTSKTIDKFAFANEATMTDVGDLVMVASDNPSAHTDKNSGYGYVAGGENSYPSPSLGITTTALKLIQKFSTSSDGNAVDAVTELDKQRYRTGSNSNPSHGYVSAGTSIGPPTTSFTNDIVKYSFTSTDVATDVGDLTNSLLRPGSSSSTASGYNHGGSSPSMLNVIQKFSFTSDGNATDVGDLTVTTSNTGGLHQ